MGADLFLMFEMDGKKIEATMNQLHSGIMKTNTIDIEDAFLQSPLLDATSSSSTTTSEELMSFEVEHFSKQHQIRTEQNSRCALEDVTKTFDASNTCLCCQGSTRIINQTFQWRCYSGYCMECCEYFRKELISGECRSVGEYFKGELFGVRTHSDTFTIAQIPQQKHLRTSSCSY